MRGAELDTVQSVETPEGVLLELSPAGLPARLFAYLLDFGIRLALMSVVGRLATLGGIGVALWPISAFLLEWLYPVVFELSASGATPGKRVFGLTVLMDDGLPVTLAASVTRN